jgi:hypothetical protein
MTVIRAEEIPAECHTRVASRTLLSAENWGQLHSIDLNSQPYAAAVQKLELEVCQVAPEMFWKLEDG